MLKSCFMKKPPASAQKTYTSRGASTRQRIVDATASLTYAKGVEGTSLDDVRAAAGVSKSQLYHYFADKDALVREVISAQAAHVLAAQGTALTQLDSLAALRRWCDCILALNRGARKWRMPDRISGKRTGQSIRASSCAARRRLQYMGGPSGRRLCENARERRTGELSRSQGSSDRRIVRRSRRSASRQDLAQ